MNWSTFGTSVMTALGGAGGAALSANPNLITDITALAFKANKPTAAQEDVALAQAEAEYPVSPTLAIKAVERCIGLIPPTYLAVIEALSMLKADTPVFTAIQAIEIARSKLKQAPGS